ncbi:glycosyltransferase 87 family protein [Cryobacterium sp. PH31-AA6]|uniref:glycosyltransferase 87 family protein n=1 Tax=Cryobacterium sp. PH31-AA6 TaxID=3046205 RepID=UPI0024BB14DD|nr:glycosyltransferase 87 family protein [Cryobacterium sp. PH31-AA6]MDJ0323850.1 glycosyltransferase 87 family protein [Cryobacterium sp. PH31-AA6]
MPESVARHAAAPRALLWVGFALVHLVLVALCFLAPGWPLGDVEKVYADWATGAVVGHTIVGIDTGFVYPILAFVPILASLTFGRALFAATWLGIVVLLNGVAFAFLLGRGRNRRALLAAGWWLAFLLLLGPIALARIDAVTAAMAVVAVLWVRTRPIAATVLLTAATWVKIWPVAMIAALFVVARARWRVLAVFLGTSAAIVAAALGLGSGAHVFSFVSQQTDRGIQIESPVAGIWLWQAALGIPGSFIYYDHQILTYQIIGTGTGIVIVLMTPLLVLAVAAILLLGWLARRRGADWDRLYPPLVLALVLTLILVNKVGSPQFVGWLAAPVILGLLVRGRAWRLPAVLLLVIAALTQLVYPYLYGWLLDAAPFMVLVLSVRNLLEFVLLGWALRQLWRSGSRA